VVGVELLDAPSPLPAPESFMDTLDPIIYRIFPTYGSLDEHQHDELRLLLAEETQRWIEEDVPAGRTAKVHLAIGNKCAVEVSCSMRAEMWEGCSGPSAGANRRV
jgi:hypothetical protein